MTVYNFTKDYIAFDNKREFMMSHIKRTYLPIKDKIQIASRIAKQAYMIGDKYEPHRSIGKMMIQLEFFKAYTDVAVEFVDKKGNVKTDSQYDLLKECGAMDYLIDVLNDEYSILIECFNNAVADLKEVETDTWAVAKRELSALGQTFGVASQAFVEYIQKELKPEEIRAAYNALIGVNNG